MGMAKLQIKRVYEPRSPGDGQRVLVDRVWPREISKAKLGDAIWLKDVAPSTELTQMVQSSSRTLGAILTHYAAELKHNFDTITKLRAMCARGAVTLLYSARDVQT